MCAEMLRRGVVVVVVVAIQAISIHSFHMREDVKRAVR